MKSRLRHGRLRCVGLIVPAWLAAAPFVFASGHAGTHLEIESGVAFNGYNDVRIPAGTGTLFSLTDDLESEPAGFFRLRAGVGFGERHELSLLVAPLRIEAQGAADRAIDFNGVEFPGGSNLAARYRFDSYRLTYLYAIWRHPRVRLDLGVTAKIRDAAIRVAGAGLTTEKANTGFVPLVAFRFSWEVDDGWRLLLMGDALASPGGQGRAEDVFLGVVREIGPHWSGRLGYRVLEGGADVEEVYNFALVHYASVAVEHLF